MENYVLKKCDTCMFAVFNYSFDYRLQSVYCKKINQSLHKTGYRKLKFCNYYINKNFDID